MNKLEIGHIAEDRACQYLIANDYRIIERNWYSKVGEIDIIAYDKDILVFCEVRSRKKSSLLKPEETISEAKFNKIIKAIELYLSDNNLQVECRIDFIGVVYGSKINDNLEFCIESHYENVGV